MTSQNIHSRVRQISETLKTLTTEQLNLIEVIAAQFTVPFDKITRLSTSDLISNKFMQNFGDMLRIHHCMSKEPFTKDKFEYAFEKILLQCGLNAKLASRGNPGHDITINGVNVSLKSQADRNINPDSIHISKFMELGKGTWGDSPSDLIGLRQHFFDHMHSYDRIFTLRCLSHTEQFHYELVEIPKSLLLEAENGILKMKLDSKQNPKPGYCHVLDENGKMKFQLYFDGGTERKLQIKYIKKSLCKVHAEWKFTLTISQTALM